jgi:2,4-diketo-3-deoxy-L-fuconate hydrolase
MRLANRHGRAVIVVGDACFDVETESEGKFGPDPMSVFTDWERFLVWHSSARLGEGSPYSAADLGPPVPRPQQVFAVGLNYREHAAESNFAIPSAPVVFTKYPTCLTGPSGDIELVPGDVDWEAELVVVIGREARRVAVEKGWDYVAGLTVGQDISERVLQRSGPAPQFGLAKSYPQFGPTGPAVVTLDEIPSPDDLAIACVLSGEVVQQSRTSQQIFSVPDLISRLSHVVTLLAGDLVFTGTPSGVGMGRKPQRFLAPGDVLVTSIEGLGEMTHTMVAPAESANDTLLTV